MLPAWLLLALSGLLNIGWLVTLEQTHGFRRIVPLMFNAAFGLSSTYCLSRALQLLPMSAAYVIYTALSVAGAVGFDMVVLKQPLGNMRLASLSVILVGILGLRMSATR